MPFLFYDLETSGLNRDFDQVYQFAAVSTDDNLVETGETYNILCLPRPDVLPSPEAILTTGIDIFEQKKSGINEFDLSKWIYRIMTNGPDQCAVGYNTIHFDDEFIRRLFYRNLQDPYRWHWYNNNSRLDIYPIILTAYAVRPEGIQWPENKDKDSFNLKLTTLTELNNIKHKHAHDALSDVYATLALARSIKQKQPQLFEYFLKLRDKKFVNDIIEKNSGILIYVSKYFGHDNKYISPVLKLCIHPINKNEYIFVDLRKDVNVLLELNSETIHKHLFSSTEAPEGQGIDIPLLTIKINTLPAIFTPKVLNEKNLAETGIDITLCKLRAETIKANLPALKEKILSVYKKSDYAENDDVDAQIYSGFFSDTDQDLIRDLISVPPDDWREKLERVGKTRVKKLARRILARNFPNLLTPEEKSKWNEYINKKLTDENEKYGLTLNAFHNKIKEIKSDPVYSKSDLDIINKLDQYVSNLI